MYDVNGYTTSQQASPYLRPIELRFPDLSKYVPYHVKYTPVIRETHLT